jgi:hypothetical protein
MFVILLQEEKNLEKIYDHILCLSNELEKVQNYRNDDRIGNEFQKLSAIMKRLLLLGRTIL